MKQFRQMLSLMSILVMLTVLTGCGGESDSSPTDPGNTLSVILTSDKTVYSIGEKIIFTVRANLDCYLTLYNTNAVGTTTQIFPNQMASDNFLEGGVTYQIPVATDTFDFWVIGPPGTEQIRAVVVDASNATRQAEDVITIQVVE